MRKQTLGNMIAAMRKEQGMTQADLAAKMGVTDKAVSKWERDLSCPDVNSLPRLCEVFGISMDELMQVKEQSAAGMGSHNEDLARLILRAVPLAMGVAVVVLSVLRRLDAASGMGMLGVAVICLAALHFLDAGKE